MICPSATSISVALYREENKVQKLFSALKYSKGSYEGATHLASLIGVAKGTDKGPLVTPWGGDHYRIYLTSRVAYVGTPLN